ncbi:MAG: hypothetical protein HZB41_14625 [Ignavibacteriae bacterium]|nr:hypothetical protein [Ignavibacteriota bacterium]
MKVDIYSLIGEKIKTVIIEEQLENKFYIGDLSPGLYYLNFDFGKNFILIVN